MSDLEQLLSKLSPEKRRLLELKLKKKGSLGNAFPLSYAQQRLWFLHQLEPESTAYHIPAAVRLKGSLNIEALEKSFREIIKRHEILRTTFTTINGTPMQVVSPQVNLQLRQTDLSSLAPEERERRMQELLESENNRPFDLSKGPLLRLHLIKMGEDDHVLHILMHHIISDGWSVNVFVKEFSQLYRSFLSGQPASLPPLKIQYADFAVWQKKKLESEIKEKQLAYWKEKLGGSLPVLELPSDHPRPAVKSYRGSHRKGSITGPIVAQIREMASRHQTTVFMTLLAAFYALLYRYTQQEDMCVGIPIANRNRAETEGLIGFFVNTLVLRNDLSDEPSFAELLKRTRDVSLEAFSHQDLPFEMLVEELQPERNMSHTPLFQVMFVFQNAGEGQLELPGLKVEPVPLGNENAKFDLTLTVSETPDEFLLDIEYDTDLFEPDTIDRMLAHYNRLLQEMAAHPETPITRLDMLTAEERRLLLDEWVPKGVSYPKEKCVHQLFEEQAEKFSQRIALTLGNEHMTYGELNARANKLAHYLIKQGVQPDDLVAIYSERVPHLLVAILGVLKAGAAYLPIDPVYPPERVQFMLQDAEAKFILTQSELHPQLTLNGQQVFLLDDDWPKIEGESEENPKTAVTPDHLIYVIYTSGSTGKPKGTLITHYNVVRLFQATDHWYRFNENDVWTLFHSYAFDFSVWEIWGAFLYGGRLVIVPQLTARSPEQFYELLINEKVTVLNQTPSAFRQLIQAEEQVGKPPYRTDLRYVIFGGEALELNSLRPWFERHGDRQPQLVNMYGITETTVHVTYRPISLADLEANKGSVIGQPIPDLPVYILDRHLQPAPIGVPGEICVAGAGLARGYLKRPELTSVKFVPHPFSDAPDARLYRSGDLARYLKDGDIEYIGRIDNQIKIRGFRIELGEIETLLAKHPDIRECLVTTAKDARGDAIIAAYLVPEKGHEITSHQLRDYLREKLPEYMVPSAFVLLDAFPLTPNGKIDRKALPDPAQHRLDLQREYVAPKTPTEEILAQIFAEILKIPKVGSNDHFFELGGHSLLATQLTSRIRDALGVDIPLKILFENPVVHDLGRAIDQLKLKQEGMEEPPIVPIDRSGELPLSFAQQRLWFLHQLDPNDASYNIPAAFRVRGPLNVQRLQQVFDRIAQRHETLRTVFKTVDGKPHVEILPQSPVKIEHIVLPDDQKDAAAIESIIIEEARKPFDLEKGPLTRVKVLQLADDHFVIVLNMHHIISDGWSMGILMNEVAALYRAFSANQPDPLPPLRIQYVDFAAWQRQWLSGRVLEEQLNYWKRVLGNGSPPLQLPTDKPRPVTPTSNGAHLQFKIDKATAEAMNAFCQQHNVTPFMAFLAAFMVLLHKYSGQEDISVGTPIANRNRSEIENIIGFFVNTLVMRADLSGDPTFADFLRQIRETALGAYAHQDLPFEKLVDAIQTERDVRHTPLFQVMFMMQNLPRGSQDVSDITIEELKVENGLSQFELTLALTEVDDGLNASLEYNTDLFEEETMRRLADHFVRVVQSVLNEPQQPLSHISLIAPEDEQKITREWNATQRELPRMAIHHLIEVQAEDQPEKVAVVSGDVQMTYGELNDKANRIAAYLQQKGLGKGDRVGLSLRRSPDLIAALLGILKSGAAYVPLDANYPQERLSFMIEDADIAFLITEKALKEAIPAKDIPMLVLDETEDWPDSTAYVAPEFNGDEPAYIIYTSGSTGLPKGVVVSHRSVVNHNLAIAEIFELQDCDRVLQFATVNFDAAGEEIYPTLQNGATLVLRGNEVLISGQQLLELTETYGITIWDLPTAYWHQVLAEIKQLNTQIPNTLRLLSLGGDKLSAERYKEWLQVGGKRVRTLNTYGPTEGTIDSIVFECPNTIPEVERLGEIPIGRPIANTRAYVLDKNLKPVPIGIPGELFLGGACVAQGYWKRPELTSERFLPDPFSDEPNARMYRTGDLVRWRADGNIEYIGRTDHQVKIRGFRVELEEIEHAILEFPEVKDAAVIVRQKQADTKQLVAYLVFKEGAEGDTSALRKKLQAQLPEYMVPAVFVKMEALPYLPSGKIDRRALPEPSETTTERKTEYVAPRNDKERILAEIWQQVLGIKQIGVDDNFFELGGDSILSIQVIARARQQGLQITPVQIFQYQTIAGLAAVAQEAEVIRAEQGLVTGTAPLTPIQHWFFDEGFEHPEHWNQSLLLQVHEALEATHLEKVTRALLEHHDALRLRIKEENGQRLQEFAPMPERIPFYHFDLRGKTADEQKQAIEAEAAKLQASFDLQEGCLLRLAYFDTGDLPHRILIIVHHLAMDGVSWRILLEDVQLAYQQAASGKEIQLPPKTTSFKEWAEKLRAFANSPEALSEADYWKSMAQKEQPTLFPDFPQGENSEQFAAGVADFLDEAQTKALLTDVPPVYKTEINDILLTALTRAFARWNGKRALLINMEGHGREDILPATDISRTVGWFTSLYPVYLNLETAFEPGDSIKTIKEQLRAIPNNGIGYGLLRYLNEDATLREQLKGLDHAPITFNYLGQFDQALPEGSIFKPAREAKGPERHPQDKRSSLLDITCAVTAGKLNISFTFSKRVFKEETVRPFVGYFKEELQTLIAHCQSPQAGGVTASDFKLANLDNKKLDKVLSQLQKGKKKKK
jgi:amino acid adenylation domain-containing protein/non-ribosomal peptide synthase protein (TIGR01720 family)